jgi:DtxR family Mn-dependent transcriptional regulator
MPDPLISLLIAGVIALLIAWFFWPERGLFPSWQRARRMTERVLIEDTLKHIHLCELEHHLPTLESIAGALNVSTGRAADLLDQMFSLHLARMAGGEIRLTSEGRDYSLRIIRAHRLWEQYLAKETGYSTGEWHRRAHRHEHILSTEETDALSSRLWNPLYDPHGDPIPSSSGQMRPHGGQSLTAMSLNKPLKIVHIEDEPETVYDQLIAEGLRLGMFVQLVEVTPQRIRFWANGDEHILAPIVAANLSVVPVPDTPTHRTPTGKSLSGLHPGEKAQVLSLSPAFRSVERRRLMDLGIIPGTVVESELCSVSGDPTAYRIRGALIALRNEQANLIKVTHLKEAPHDPKKD